MKNKQERRRHHNRQNLTHSHDNEMEGKRLLECKIDGRKQKTQEGWIGGKQGREERSEEEEKDEVQEKEEEEEEEEVVVVVVVVVVVERWFY